MEDWLLVSQVAELTGLTERAIRKQVTRGKLMAVAESSRVGQGGKRYLVALSSLAPELQAQWHLQRIPQPPTTQEHRPTSQTALDLVKVIDRHGEDELAKAVSRASVAKAALDLEGPERASYIRKKAVEVGVSERTIYRWMNTYAKEGAVVDRTKTRDVGGYGSRTLPPEAIKFIEGSWLQLKQPTAMSCMRLYNEIAPAKRWPTVSRATFFRIIKAIPPAIVKMGREGDQAYRHTCMPKAKRTREGLRRNEEWALDHKQLDFWCDYNGHPIRPWLSGTVDWASACLVGASFAVKPNGESIARSFASAVYPKEDLPFRGLPARVYMDNGKDYRGHRISGQEEVVKVNVGPAVQGWLQLCRVEFHYAIGRSPWAKAVIERAFGDVTEFCREQVSFCGISKDTKPEYMTSAYVKKLCAEGRLPKFRDLPRLFWEWYRRTYLTWPSEAFDGRSRLDVYTSLPPVREDMPSTEVSFLLFGKGATAKVFKTGIHKFGKEYWFWADELAPYVNKTVTIRWTPNRIGELYVFYKGRFVCRVENRELLRINATEEDVKEWMKRQSRARKHIREEVTARRQTVADVVLERTSGGPPVVALPVLDSPISKVTTLTNLEKAAKARIRLDNGQADPPTPNAQVSLRDRYLFALYEKAQMAEGQ